MYSCSGEPPKEALLRDESTILSSEFPMIIEYKEDDEELVDVAV